MKVTSFIIVIKRRTIRFILLSIVIFIFSFIAVYGVKAYYEGKAEASVNYVDSDNDQVPAGRLAIIIDDFGQNRRGVEQMMSIPRHLTLAVMPFLTYSEEDAKAAHEKGYEVIVHLPLEANGGKPSWVGPRPIRTGMDSEEIKKIVKDAFDNVPHAIGANIHMGSKAGNDEHVITSILDFIKENDLIFVDSRSESHPVAKRIADMNGVTCYERNVFLDGKKPKSYITEQLKKAGEIALKNGKAIAIGHVGTEGGQVTAEAIEEMLPWFDEKNIKIFFVSELDQ